jgi:hypothetical protein
MPYYTSVNGDVQDQINRTDVVIKRFINSDIIYFRSPYGKWSAEVASDLNSNLTASLGHLGPIYWDIGGIDCYYWQHDRSVDDAVAAYYKEITEKKKGIVVFHDDIADMEYVKPKQKTLQLLQSLIPRLKTEGYTFVGLEDIESIKKAADKGLTFHLRTRNKKYISIRQSPGSGIYSISRKSKYAEFTLESCSDGKIALKSSKGFYLGVENQEGNKVMADKSQIETACLFDLIPVIHSQFMLRASNGNYLVINKEGNLVANAPYMRNSEIFSYCAINVTVKKNLPLGTHLLLLKKRFLYLKSKLLQAS